MKKTTTLLITILLIPIVACASSRKPQSLKDNTVFTQKLEAIRVKYKLPAIAAIVVNNENIINVGASGLRAIEAHEDVTIFDKFHLGSNTKSMTATLLAKMIEEGHFSWNDSLELVFSDLTIHKDFKASTLEQLLRHQGGVTSNLIESYPKMWSQFWKMQSDDSESALSQRSLLAKTVLIEKPSFKIGLKSNYSNAGITLVGHAIEKKMKGKYEDIIKKSLFTDLGMESCGFGAAGEPGRYNQPRGHVSQNGKVVSVNPGPYADNPDAIAPAGKVHCSIVDWGRYIQEHLKGSQGNSDYLKTSSFKKLHSPLKDQVFGLGWIEMKPKWAKGDRLIFHNGSNTMNYGEMWISPKENYAVAVVSNIGGADASRAVREAVISLVNEYLIAK